MRTTLELPEQLFRRAKLIALQRRITLKRLITAAVERELDMEQTVPHRMMAPPISLEMAPSVPVLSNAEIASLLVADELLKTK